MGSHQGPEQEGIIMLNELVKLECCVTDFNASSKDDALKQMSKFMKSSSVFENVTEQDIYNGLETREQKGSTGFADGIAIPHCQIKGIEEFAVGLIVSKKGIQFDAIDNKKSHIFAVILGPEGGNAVHLKLLAQIARILKEKETCDLIINSESKTSLFECFMKNADHDNVEDLKEKQKEKMMILVVRDQDTLESITEIFVEYGIQDALIVDANKMENLLTKIPLFLGFFNFTEEDQDFNKVIIAKINENYINALLRGFEDNFGDLENFSNLSVMVIDIFLSIGI
jgi:mannitol/fructose-specific phosphotransferase system IIA component (Ntr-type)